MRLQSPAAILFGAGMLVSAYRQCPVMAEDLLNSDPWQASLHNVYIKNNLRPF